MDIGLALLAHLGLQTKYWVDAFLTAIYFINHLPTPTLSKSTHSRCGILCLRAPTADVGYVPNAKYLAHIPHQTKFDPIYQMF